MPADNDVRLVVNGVGYEGFESIRVTRSIESIAGSFALQVSDRWGGLDRPWPIREEDECSVFIGEDLVISGFVDKRAIAVTKDSRTLTYTGRDRAAALVDCSATAQGASVVAKAGAAGDIDPSNHSAESTKWVYSNIDVAAFARVLAAPFGVSVTVQPGLKLERAPKLIVHPGEKAFEALKRACEEAQVLAVSDGAGGILLTRSSTSRAAALVLGFNVLAASVDYDGTDRFHRYLISCQIPGTDEASGDATQVQAQAVDVGVRRTSRTILIRPDKGYNTATARRRADWEARTRAARAEPVSVTVQGWRQQGGEGELWAPNLIAPVHVKSIGIDGADAVISQVEFSIDSNDGRITQLRLLRPDAFIPEPTATVGDGPSGWPELTHGADPEPAGR